MKSKKAISLIVLVITIIIMIILASAIIMSLDNANIFNKAEEAVEKTNAATNKYLSEIKLAERELEKIQGASPVTDTTPNDLRQEDDTYYIESIDDLVTFSNRVNAGETFEGKTVKLTRLLDFNSDNSYVDKSLKGQLIGENSSEGFTPIGKRVYNGSNWEEKPFKGTFDGDGAEIRNLYINTTSDNVGLFGFAVDANFYNVGVTGNVTTTGESAGGLLGYIDNTQPTIIANCYNKANISAEGIAGGVVAQTWESITIEDCYNVGAITSQSGDGVGGVAGFFGYEEGMSVMNRCYNTGTIKGRGPGGVVGIANTAIIKNVYNLGNILNVTTTDGICIGGIVAEVQGADIYNSYNAGNIEFKAAMYIGGIAGHTYSKMINCYNIGNIAREKGYQLVDGVAATVEVEKLYYVQEGTPPVKSNDVYNPELSQSPELIAKPLSYMKSQAFVDELNSNIQGRDDLVRWKMGPNGYPTLDI